MVVFDKKEAKKGKMIYEVNEEKLHDNAYEEGKFCYTKAFINQLMDELPEKQDALDEVYDYVDDLVQNMFDDAESALIIHGMNIILSKIDKAID